ncbi:MAG: restriction endonuclease subunit S [Pseudonocardia sp.]|nr:restriction endonuclease subunit S [Pseudonocardia sp.]
MQLQELAADEKGAISKPYGSAILREDYRSSGVPIVRGVNLARGIFVDDGFVFIDTALADSMPGASLRSGDLVFTHRGSVGQVSMIPRRAKYERYATSTSQVKARLDPFKALPEFYYYWFQSAAGRGSILQSVSAVGVPGLVQPVDTVKRLLVPLLDLPDQQAVVNVLGAIDEKILLNERTGVVIEELTRAKFLAAASREVPKAPVSFASICVVGGGGTPRTTVSQYWDGDVCWATPTDVTALSGPYLEGTARSISDAGLAACSSPLYPEGSILMTSRATIGAFAVAGRPMAVNQGFIVVNPLDKRLKWWIFHEMQSRVDEFVNQANGATFLELGRGKFKNLPVCLPDDAVMLRFCTEADELHAAARNALIESAQLAELRDALIPALISGRLRVRDAEKQVEDVL